MLWLHPWHVGRKVVEEVFNLVRAERVVFLVPLLRLLKALAVRAVLLTLSLVAELVVEVLVEEHLRHYLMLASRASQAVGVGGSLERVDEGEGSLLNVVVAHCLYALYALPLPQVLVRYEVAYVKAVFRWGIHFHLP